MRGGSCTHALPRPKWRTPKGTQLRHCAKVALAAVVAYALTLGGRNDYALFSVLGAALVVGGSVGEDLSTSLNRVRGTVAGALVGAALAIVLGKTIWSLGIAVGVMACLSVGLAGLLSELQQIRTALLAMRDSDGRAATR